MNILIFTQKVDANDKVLGFFHTWLKEFSKKFSHVTVICLSKGEVDLPENISVISLGKDEGKGKVSYIYSTLKLSWTLRKKYSHVFVHMNEEYVLVAGLLWRVLGKKIGMWRNHPKGSWKTRMAVAVSHVVFYTSPQSFTARFSKTVRMPVGIDTGLFSPRSQQKIPGSIASIGRSSPVTHVDLIVEACAELIKKNANLALHIYGSPTEVDMDYMKHVQETAAGVRGIEFFGPVVYTDLPHYYSRHELFINMTDPGSFDKTIFEAMACGCLVVVANPGLANIVHPSSIVGTMNSEAVESAIQNTLALPESEKHLLQEKYINTIRTEHSLTALVGKLYTIFQSQ